MAEADWLVPLPAKTLTGDEKFAGLKGTRLSPTGVYDPAGKTYNAMVYVFCTHITRDHAGYDQLQLDQCEFDVVPRSKLLELNQASIGLAGVRRLSGAPTPWASLAAAVTAASQGDQPRARHYTVQDR